MNSLSKIRDADASFEVFLGVVVGIRETHRGNSHRRTFDVVVRMGEEHFIDCRCKLLFRYRMQCPRRLGALRHSIATFGDEVEDYFHVLTPIH